MNSFSPVKDIYHLLYYVALVFTSLTINGYGQSFQIVADAKAKATIVTSDTPTVSARLASLELQHHIEKITGIKLEIKPDQEQITGNLILVGESRHTQSLGVKASDFKATEYLIKFKENKLILMGLDWIGPIDSKLGNEAFDGRTEMDYNKAIKASNKEPLKITIPSYREEQGSCYAVYDFLERFCHIKWYGPGDIHTIIPKSKDLIVEAKSIRRFPSIKHRQLQQTYIKWPTENRILHSTSSEAENIIFLRRKREGGLRWKANHSSLDGVWRIDEETRDKLGFTDERLVKKIVKAARDFFDGKGLPEFTKYKHKGMGQESHVFAMGDFYCIVPWDQGLPRESEEDERVYAISAKDERGLGFFGQAKSSYYFFQLVNRVAREIKKTHPDKYLATLAYDTYSYKPKGLKIEPNVAVAPCLATCGYQVEDVHNDYKFYKEWAEWSKETGAPLFVWDYYHHPYEPGLMKGYNVFPLFCGDFIADKISMWYRDGVEGIFACGVPLMPDAYLHAKMSWDTEAYGDYQKILDEFFLEYFGPKAGEVMKKVYTRILEINKKEGIVGLSQADSWEYLGTKKRVKELASYFEEAEYLIKTDVQKKRFELWKKALLDRMIEGRNQYLGY